MRIEVLVQGDLDTELYTRVFCYNETNAQIVQESTQIIKDYLSKNMRLNVNQALEMFAAFVMVSLNERKTAEEIAQYITKLLSADQVMIGVPESLRRLIFTVTDNEYDISTITVREPIGIHQYYLRTKTVI